MIFINLLSTHVQAQTNTNVQVAVQTGAWHAITSANLVVQLTLLCLAALSALSWAIILLKRKQIHELKIANPLFEEMFWKSSSLDLIYDKLKEHSKSNLANVFRSGYLELRKIAGSNLAQSANKDGETPMLSGLDNLERALKKAIDNEVSSLELRLSFLATTGSTGPFIGLFGTVWGIMSAFQKIGATGVASLAVVAPGISEALIATGVGLFAAIPATVGYNYFVTQIKQQELALSNFAADFLNIAKRNFFKDQ